MGSVPAIDPSVLNVLLAEIRMLGRQLEQASSAQTGARSDDGLQASVEILLSRLDSIPDRIADAVAAALAVQHRMIMDDIRTALDGSTAGLDT